MAARGEKPYHEMDAVKHFLEVGISTAILRAVLRRLVPLNLSTAMYYVFVRAFSIRSFNIVLHQFLVVTITLAILLPQPWHRFAHKLFEDTLNAR